MRARVISTSISNASIGSRARKRTSVSSVLRTVRYAPAISGTCTWRGQEFHVQYYGRDDEMKANEK